VAQRLKVDMPLCEAVYQVLYERLPVDEVVHGLMSRPIKAETE
jgi:glycerol-3-phosphate dehydrogenase (NAD(P)+)